MGPLVTGGEHDGSSTLTAALDSLREKSFGWNTEAEPQLSGADTE